MSSIDSLPSGKYKVRWRANGQQYSKIFSKKVDARSHLTTIDGDLLQGRWIDPRAGTVTVAAFAHEWAASANWRPETRARNEHTIRLHIAPTVRGEGAEKGHAG